MATAARLVRTARLDVPVLRWTYWREGDRLDCELALTDDLSAYELHLAPARLPHAPPSQLFDDAVSAFQRQATLHRWLEADGWTLAEVSSHRRYV